jgi:hypothetical protein
MCRCVLCMLSGQIVHLRIPLRSLMMEARLFLALVLLTDFTSLAAGGDASDRANVVGKPEVAIGSGCDL